MDDAELRKQLDDAKERIAQLERACASLLMVLRAPAGIIDLKIQDAIREGKQVRPVFRIVGTSVSVDFIVRADLPKVTPPEPPPDLEPKPQE
jgi:hypothetical protein